MSNDKKTILLLASNPTKDLELSEEFRDIEECIEKSKNRDWYDIRLAGATRYKDLQQKVEKHMPHIVHISGHGVKNGIFLQDDKKNEQLISSQRLFTLFKNINKKIECIVLNTCHSNNTAKIISKTIPCVIGMNSSIKDQSAIEFSTGFYSAIGSGYSYLKAFNLGVAAINNTSLPYDRGCIFPENKKNNKDAPISSIPEIYCETGKKENIKSEFIFTNREKELKEIIDGNYSYHLLLAPFKYGKTTLLNKVENEYKKKKWITFKATGIETGNKNTIVKKLTGGKIENTSDFYNYICKNFVNHHKKNKNDEIGIAVLLDLAKFFPKKNIEIIHNNFIKPLWNTLENFGLEIDQFRVIITHTPLVEIKSTPYYKHFLSEFNYDVILKSINKYRNKNNIGLKKSSDIAAQIIYKTGGYPLCVKRHLTKLNKNQIPKNIDCLNAAIGNFNNAISAEATILLKNGDLSIYRYIDKKILEKSKTNLLAKSTSDLFTNLLTENAYKTYSYKNIHSKEIISDSLIRRIYSIKYRTERPDDFIEVCNDAAKIYLYFLKYNYKGDKFSTLWLIEHWYQLLQARQTKYSTSRPNIGSTRRLKDSEIINGLTLLSQHTEKKYQYWCAFINQQLEDDWEFKFLLCYNTYTEQYDPEKFKDFQRHIKYICSKIHG